MLYYDGNGADVRMTEVKLISALQTRCALSCPPAVREEVSGSEDELRNPNIQHRRRRKGQRFDRIMKSGSKISPLNGGQPLVFPFRVFSSA